MKYKPAAAASRTRREGEERKLKIARGFRKALRKISTTEKFDTVSVVRFSKGTFSFAR